MPAISKELDRLSVDLIDAGMEALVADRRHMPVMLALDCEDDILTFEDDTPDGCYRAARSYVHGLKSACNRYAILYQGEISRKKGDPSRIALIVEFAERGMEQAWSGYMFYRFDEHGEIEITEPQPAGEEDLLFG